MLVKPRLNFIVKNVVLPPAVPVTPAILPLPDRRLAPGDDFPPSGICPKIKGKHKINTNSVCVLFGHSS